MARKIKTIALTFPHANPHAAIGVDQRYLVVRVTDSTEFNPGQFLTKHEVDELCACADWQVSTKRPTREER